jgi:N-acetylglucosaminyldiphosphoundecaprenol N-acetyl-beta-D-mannosaminyltransferase
MPKTSSKPRDDRNPPPGRVCFLWGVPLSAITYEEALESVITLIERREPSYFVTANMNYAMLASRLPELDEVNRGADFIVADGVPFVWISSWKGVSLPERIAGSDLIFDLCRISAIRGYKVFLLGGAPGVADAAASNLCLSYPGLRIVGVACPWIHDSDDRWQAELSAQIRRTEPDLLFAALGMPKGEILLARHHRQWGVPVCVQVGMSLDIAANRIRRAPRWVQRMGLEMFHRIALEPRRLIGRYSRNFLFMVRMIAKDLRSVLASRMAVLGVVMWASPSTDRRPGE